MPEIGRFRAQIEPMLLASEGTTKVRIQVSVAGYEKAEQIAVLTDDQPWPQPELRMQARTDSESTTEGAPSDVIRSMPDGYIGPGILCCWIPRPLHNAPNTPIHRGVPVTGGGMACDWTTVDEQGRRLGVRVWKGAWLSLFRPGLPDLWWRLPSKVSQSGVDLDMTLVESGSVEGRIEPFDPETHGQLYVVAFDNTLIRYEVRVTRGGRFTFAALPEGEYGLTSAGDAFGRLRDEHGEDFGFEDHERAAQPWRGAVRIEVQSGVQVRDVVVPLRHRATD